MKKYLIIIISLVTLAGCSSQSRVPTEGVSGYNQTHYQNTTYNQVEVLADGNEQQINNTIIRGLMWGL